MCSWQENNSNIQTVWEEIKKFVYIKSCDVIPLHYYTSAHSSLWFRKTEEHKDKHRQHSNMMCTALCLHGCECLLLYCDRAGGRCRFFVGVCETHYSQHNGIHTFVFNSFLLNSKMMRTKGTYSTFKMFDSALVFFPQ